MKRHIFFALSGLTALLLIFSCKKSDQHPGPPNPTGSIRVSSQVDSGTEVIFSEPGGKVLMDSLFGASTNFTASLSTNAQLIDLTTIQYYSYDQFFYVKTYKAINPTNWTSVTPLPYSVPVPHPDGPASTITYLFSTPPNTGPPFSIFSSQTPGYSGGYSYVSTPVPTLTINYTRLGDYPVYLLFTANGQYNFYTPRTTADTIKNPVLDTAQFIKPALAAEYTTVAQLSLNAYLDTTNFVNSVSLLPFTWGQNLLTQGLLVPKQPFIEKYELSTTLFGNADNATFYSYADSVPSVFPIPDPSYYSLASTQLNDFSVTFPKTKPTFYITTWSIGNISWNIVTSSDSTTLHPQQSLPLLQGSKLLKNKDFSSSSFANLALEMAEGFDYEGFVNYTFDSVAVKNKRIASFVEYSKAY